MILQKWLSDLSYVVKLHMIKKQSNPEDFYMTLNIWLIFDFTNSSESLIIIQNLYSSKVQNSECIAV